MEEVGLDRVGRGREISGFLCVFFLCVCECMSERVCETKLVEKM